MPTGIHYSAVELCTYNNDLSKAWFVYFDIRNNETNVIIRKQFRGGINYSHNVAERTRVGNELKK
jgi:hypothetical protein